MIAITILIFDSRAVERQLRVEHFVDAGRIAEARFRCRGCTTSIACASLLTEELHGKEPSDIQMITAESLSRQLDTLPPATYHGAELAADAAKALQKKLSAAGV